MYDESGSPIGFRRQVGTTSTPYYYVKNLQGDIVAIARGGDGAILARYAYDAWGNILSITDNAGHDISNKPNEIANIIPCGTGVIITIPKRDCITCNPVSMTRRPVAL